MIKRYFVRTRSLEEGMRIDQHIKDRLDRTLIARGTYLDQYMIKELQKLGIAGIYVSEGEEDIIPEKKEPPLPPKIQKTIDKERREDPSKVMLTESVKQRVSTGIQYLYNNTDTGHFANTTTSITNDLMKAINDNSAIAVDISALKTSDEYTFKHSVDVATISMIIAKNMEYSHDDIYSIGIAGLLHDIGKSKVPLEILNKPAKLDDAEFEVMKKHTVFGYEILKEKENFSKSIALAVLQHHEKMNGKGYPLGVSSDKISNFAKILSVADVYDALVTERPYKKGLSQRTAIEIIISMTAELDIDAMKSFLETVILYPVDTNVTLSNGEQARVVRNNKGCALRPTVVSLTTGQLYNLADDVSCANLVIQ